MIYPIKYTQEFESTTVDTFAGNTAFGSRDLPTSVAITTARSYSGNQSLRTTWAAAGANPQWVGRNYPNLEVGKTYTMVCRVYVPTGAGTIAPEYLFFNTGATITQRDQWVTVAFTFTVTQAGGQYVGFKNTAPTAGTVLDIDSMRIYEGSVSDFVGSQPLILKTDAVKLEIEADPSPGAHVNKISNPNGEYGGWGWVTPVQYSAMSGTDKTFSTVTGFHLDYKTGNNTASYFYSENIPITAGTWAAASWVAPYVTYDASDSSLGYYRVSFEWLNSSKTVIGSSTITAYLQQSTNTVSYGPYQAPAGTVYMRLRFDHYGTSGGSNPNANAHVILQNVTVAQDAVSSNLTTITRTNLVTCPNFETSIGNWNANPLTSNRTTAQAQAGTACFICGSSTAPGGSIVLTDHLPVTGGKSYALSGYMRSSTAISATARINWYDASNNLISQPQSGVVNLSTSAWTRLSVIATAPASAAYAIINFGFVNGNVPGIAVYLDSVLFEQSSTLGTYFDGSTTASGYSYAWTGTANLSTSTEGVAYIGYLEPLTYLDITGSTFDIHITREGINIGTLEATVRDAAVDPANSNLLRPGKKCRLRVLESTTGSWEPLFTGEIDNGEAVYDLSLPNSSSTVVDFLAVNNVSRLANAASPYGTTSLTSFSWLLEGVGVPWSINKNPNQATSNVYDSYNESASVLDQVILTRDSNNGYAWVDRKNIFKMTDSYSFNIDPNLMPNDGTNGTITGYTTVTNCTITTALNVLSVTAISPGNLTFLAPFTPVIAGRAAIVNVWTGAAAGITRQIQVQPIYYNTAGTQVGTGTTETWTESPSNQWHQWKSNVVPAGATQMRLQVTVVGGAASEVHNFRFSTVQPVAVIDENVYSSATAGFKTSECINSVIVTVRTLNPSTLETIENSFGPYEDSVSISTWGRRQETFILATQSLASVDPAGFAAKVLAKNANPVVTIGNIEIPIDDIADINSSLALLDQYDLVQVKNTPKSIDVITRITKVEHVISTNDAWRMNIDFAGGMESVATPMQVAQQQDAELDGVWHVIGTTGNPAFENGWTHYDGRTARFMRKNGIVYLDGVIKSGTLNTSAFTLPVGYRPRDTGIGYDTSFAVPCYNNALGICSVFGNGSVVPFGSNVYFWLNGVSFPAVG